ncbi:MAG: radical SAM protein [Deltaproteobacteria bacterium]|nr:radical SAM protein [Deltaproteobacteria bacterium]
MNRVDPLASGRPLKVLLVRPRPDPETIGLQHVMLVEPLELEVLAGLCAPADRPVVVDLTLEDEPFERFVERERPDVLGVTGYITNVPAMIAHCRAAKRIVPGCATVVGGVHCEVCPGDLDDPAVDFRVVRNPVAAWPRLLDHVRGRRRGRGIVRVPPGVLRPGEAAGGASLPPFDFAWSRPDRSTTRRYRDRYFYIFHDRVALLKTAFGCPYKCSFCFCREITRGAYRERPLEDVLDELASIDEQDIYIVDDDFLVSRERVTRFLDGVRRRGIRKHYLVYGRADFVARNADLVALFREEGLRTVIVGFESFLPGELDAMRKGTDVETNVRAMEVLNRLGIDCYATLILPPHWSRAEFDATGRRLCDLGIRSVNLQPLTPLPGTGLEHKAWDLVIDRRDFPRWDLAHVTVRPERMSVADFYAEIIRLYMATLYKPWYLLGYLKYPPRMIWKMVAGTWRVRRQYLRKLADARAALPADSSDSRAAGPL